MLQYRTHSVVVKKLSATARGLALGLLGALSVTSHAAEPGVTDSAVRIGSTLVLRGDVAPIGQGMKQGMEAALTGQKVRGRSIELNVVDDAYNPATTVEAAKQLIEKGIFIMLGSTGTPTTKAVLPVLAEQQVPAVGFYTGAGFTGPGEVLNFRATYAQEVAAVVKNVLEAGVKPGEICAYVQNDAYGMSGLAGVISALKQAPDAAEIVAKLEQIMAVSGDNPERNKLGPIGVYQRDTLNARDGYNSLKEWEKQTGAPCRLVATVGVAPPTAQFIGYARFKKEKWVFSVPSPVPSAGFLTALKENKITDHVIATSVIPGTSSELAIVQEARAALQAELNAFSLEGYIVGKMFLTIMNNIQGDPTRASFLAAARGRPYDLGGINVDFTNDNQGSDFVQLTYWQEGEFKAIGSAELRQLFQ